MKNKSVKLPFVTKNSKHLMGTSGDDLPALIAQFRYIKIQPKPIDLSTRLVGINPTNSVVIPTSLVLRSIVVG